MGREWQDLFSQDEDFLFKNDNGGDVVEESLRSIDNLSVCKDMRLSTFAPFM